MKVVRSVNYFSPTEIAQLAATTGISQSSTFAKRQVQLLGFLQALGSRIGFPQRTIATAQWLLLRFHLFYNPAEFLPHEVAVTCTVVASKMNDTPKKAREVVLSSWALRYPDLVRSGGGGGGGGGGTSTAATTTPSAFYISESDIDPAVLERERRRIVSIESLVLNSIAFNFNTSVPDNFRYVVKVARSWAVERAIGQLAWQVCADCHRTYAPLMYPPATIALASIYGAAVLANGGKEDRQSETVQGLLARFEDPLLTSEWEDTFLTSIESVEEVVHTLFDLYTGAASTLIAGLASNSATPISPATPASPAEPSETLGADGRMTSASVKKVPGHVYSPPPFGLLFYAADGVGSDLTGDFTRLKIALRRREDDRRAGSRTASIPDPSVAATLLRPLETGGICEDADDEKKEDKQYASLQRFLFV